MPRTFDTPMFWAAEELEELRGTDIQGMWCARTVLASRSHVIDRVGKTEAETTYHSLLAPIIMVSDSLSCTGEVADRS
jgi:hypothetical protein